VTFKSRAAIASTFAFVVMNRAWAVLAFLLKAA